MGEVSKVEKGNHTDVVEALDKGEEAERGCELGRETPRGGGGGEGPVLREDA